MTNTAFTTFSELVALPEDAVVTVAMTRTMTYTATISAAELRELAEQSDISPASEDLTGADADLASVLLDTVFGDEDDEENSLTFKTGR